MRMACRPCPGRSSYGLSEGAVGRESHAIVPHSEREQALAGAQTEVGAANDIESARGMAGSGRLAGVALLSLLALLAACGTPTIQHHKMVPYTSTSSGSSDPSSDRLRYLLYLPRGYDDPAQAERAWPLILFLHGVGESGDDLATVARYGPPAEVERGRDLPFVIVSPQNPQFGRKWSPRQVRDALNEVMTRHRIDEERIYLTGTSMGGEGTWSTAIAYPDRFAALAPVCAFGSPEEVRGVAHVPVWAFHGGKDIIVPLRAGKAMVDAHRAAGGEARWTVEPDAGHSVWDRVYPREDLYQWFLQHRRRSPGSSGADNR